MVFIKRDIIINKIFSQESKNEEYNVFEEDFNSTKTNWRMNYWGSNNPSKTNRIENSFMIFEANDNDLKSTKKEFGAFLDLKDGIYNGCTYEISCLVCSETGTTMKFQLWLHNSKSGGINAFSPKNPFIPPNEPTWIKSTLTANEKQTIRIHLHNKAGIGKIMVDKVKVVEIK